MGIIEDTGRGALNLLSGFFSPNSNAQLDPSDMLMMALQNPATLDRLAKVLEKNPDLAKKIFQIPQLRQALEQQTAQTMGGYVTLPALLALISSIFTDKPIVPILLALAGLGIAHFFPEVQKYVNAVNWAAALQAKPEESTPEQHKQTETKGTPSAGPAKQTETKETPSAGPAKQTETKETPSAGPGPAETTGLPNGPALPLDFLSPILASTLGPLPPASNTAPAPTYPFAPLEPGPAGTISRPTAVPPAITPPQEPSILESTLGPLPPRSTKPAEPPPPSRPPAWRVPWANPQEEPPGPGGGLMY
jgi:hypothetical protein